MTKVLVLDDEPGRHKLFAEIFRDAEITQAWNQFEAECALSPRCVDVFDVATLDHDLGMNAGDGLAVARFIVAMPGERRPRQVLVHSSNPVGAKVMLETLKRAGINAMRIDSLALVQDARWQSKK